MRRGRHYENSQKKWGKKTKKRRSELESNVEIEAGAASQRPSNRSWALQHYRPLYNRIGKPEKTLLTIILSIVFCCNLQPCWMSWTRHTQWETEASMADSSPTAFCRSPHGTIQSRAQPPIHGVAEMSLKQVMQAHSPDLQQNRSWYQTNTEKA